MRSLRWVLPLLVLVPIFGCQEVKYVGGQDNPHPIHTLVSLSPSTTEIALMFISRTTLLGRTKSCNYPTSVAGIPVIMSGTKPDYERIADLHPDAAVFQDGLIGQADLDKLKSMHIQVIPVGGNTVQKWCESMAALGSATASESDLADYTDRVLSSIQKSKTNLAGRTLKVAFIMPGNGSEHMIAGTEGFLGDVLRRIGATPVGPAGANFVTMNAEDLLKENPDAILVTGDPNVLGKDARLQNTNAFKKGNVFGLQQDIALREGARVDLLVTDVGTALVRAK